MDNREHLLATLDHRIGLIEARIEKEQQNLIDSGFEPETPEFQAIFQEILLGYYAEILPLAVERHQCLPYDADQEALLDGFSMVLCGCDFGQLTSGEDARESVEKERERKAKSSGSEDDGRCRESDKGDPTGDSAV
jgi:hypothetical protein